MRILLLLAAVLVSVTLTFMVAGYADRVEAEQRARAPIIPARIATDGQNPPAWRRATATHIQSENGLCVYAMPIGTLAVTRQSITPLSACPTTFMVTVETELGVALQP
jgi:hypothetical protein